MPIVAESSKELGNAIEWAGPLVLWHHVTLQTMSCIVCDVLPL